MKYMVFKKGVHPIVASMLLLAVSVMAVVSLQGWMSSYTSELFINSEKKEISMQSGIMNVIGNKLYYKNAGRGNISLLSIEIDGKGCDVSRNLSTGVHDLNISSCIENLSTSTPEVVVYTDSGIEEKSFFISSEKKLSEETNSEVTTLSSCQSINNSGEYHLSQDINISGTCIDITSDNVNLNCKGYLIDGAAVGGDDGISSSGVSNITIENCNIQEFNDGGIDINRCNNCIFDNLHLENNDVGFYLYESNDSSIINSDFYNNSWNGVHVGNNVNLSILDNTANNNGNVGVYLDGPSGYNYTIDNLNTNYNGWNGGAFDQVGFLCYDVYGGSFSDIDSMYNQQDGISHGCNNIEYSNITASNNQQHGISIYFGWDDSSFDNVVMFNNSNYGFHLRSSSNNNSIMNSQITNNQVGLFVENDGTNYPSSNNFDYNNFSNTQNINFSSGCSVTDCNNSFSTNSFDDWTSNPYLIYGSDCSSGICDYNASLG